MILFHNKIFILKYDLLTKHCVFSLYSGITLCVTLFGDLAKNEGSTIEDIINETPIIALSDFKISMYKGNVF